MRSISKAIICIAMCILSGCGKSTQQQAAEDDAQWKESIAKAEKERIERESKLAHEAEDRRNAEAAAQERLAAQDRAVKQDELAAKIKSSMFDPDSAQFRNMRISLNGQSLCGEVNGKNKMGGYVGFKRFVVLQGSPIVESDDMRATFDAAYKAADCR